MPAALPIDARRAIVERHQEGETFRSIAADLGVSYEGVRHIWQHWQAHGTLAPRYEACGRSGIRYPQAVLTQAVTLKRAHPRWVRRSSGCSYAMNSERKPCPRCAPC